MLYGNKNEEDGLKLNIIENENKRYGTQIILHIVHKTDILYFSKK